MSKQNPVLQMQTPAVNAPTKGMRPFRQATVHRVDTLSQVVATIGANRVPFNPKVEGSGYMYRILLDVVVTGFTAATAVYTEDAPWAIFDSVVLADVNGEVLNVSGYNLFIANLCDAAYRGRFTDQSSVNTLAPTSGNFSFQLGVPIGINRRSLLGILPNQDRAQGYSLRTDIAGQASVYSTLATGVGVVTVTKFYENYSVPLQTGPDGIPQQVFPDGFGTVHYTTAIVSESAPVVGTQVPHFLRRIGNTVRWLALIFRAGAGLTPRATADTTPPTNIRIKAGEDTLFNETYRYRRARMYEQFGFDFPVGVLVYALTEDFTGYSAGGEVGDDYISSQSLVNAQVQVTYSAAFTAGSSLTIVTDDLAYATPQVAQAG